MFMSDRRYRVPKEPRLVDDLYFVMRVESASARHSRNNLDTLFNTRITRLKFNLSERGVM